MRHRGDVGGEGGGGWGSVDYLRIPILERQKVETIFLEIIIAKKKWFILFAYHLPNLSKTKLFGDTQQISVTLNKA